MILPLVRILEWHTASYKLNNSIIVPNIFKIRNLLLFFLAKLQVKYNSAGYLKSAET